MHYPEDVTVLTAAGSAFAPSTQAVARIRSCQTDRDNLSATGLALR